MTQTEMPSFDEAAEHYEHDADFFPEAVDALTAPDAPIIPDALRLAIVAWYRDTDTYRRSVEHVQTELGRLA